MKETSNKFGEWYAAYRERSGLSYRALAAVTGIKHSALVAMKTGGRPCGEQSARRLADAFGLAGEARETFVLAALNTSKEKILAGVAGYPSKVLNLVGLALLGQHILPDKITGASYDPSTPGRLQLFLKRGRTVQLQVTLSVHESAKRLRQHGRSDRNEQQA